MTPLLAHRTAAVVVIFKTTTNPAALVTCLAQSVERVVVIDNSPAGHPAVDEISSAAALTVLKNANQGGLAGAYNLAIRFLADSCPEFTHVVFLDEDSDASSLAPMLSDESVFGLLSDPNTGAVAPAYVDRTTGLRGKYIQLERWRLRYLPRVFSGLERVAFLINSMSIWRLAALRRIGAFNENLAVDHVDTEYCLRARAERLAVYVHGGYEFLHSIGRRRQFRLMGMVLQAGGHTPDRRFLIGRNTAWLGRQYLLREPAFAFLCVSRLAYEAIGIGIAEGDRLAKWRALAHGSLVGLLGLDRK